jgi:exonuclease VII large subunit
VISAKPEAYLEALKRAEQAGPDVIVLVRGGGAGVHHFNNVELAREVERVARTIPVVVGVGHANDKRTSVDRVAISVATPTEAGRYLLDRLPTAEELEVAAEELEVAKALAEQQEQIRVMGRVLAALASFAVLFLVVIIVWSLLK